MVKDKGGQKGSHVKVADCVQIKSARRSMFWKDHFEKPCTYGKMAMEVS